MGLKLSSQAVRVLQVYLDMGSGPQDISHLIDSFRHDPSEIHAAQIWIEEGITGRPINEEDFDSTEHETWNSLAGNVYEPATRISTGGSRCP